MYSSTCDVCNMCVPTYFVRSGFEMLVFREIKKKEEKEKKRGNIPFKKTKQKMQRDLTSLLEGYKTKTNILSNCATVPVLHDAAHFWLYAPCSPANTQVQTLQR